MQQWGCRYWGFGAVDATDPCSGNLPFQVGVGPGVGRNMLGKWGNKRLLGCLLILLQSLYFTSTCTGPVIEQMTEKYFPCTLGFFWTIKIVPQLVLTSTCTHAIWTTNTWWPNNSTYTHLLCRPVACFLLYLDNPLCYSKRSTPCQRDPSIARTKSKALNVQLKFLLNGLNRSEVRKPGPWRLVQMLSGLQWLFSFSRFDQQMQFPKRWQSWLLL